MVTIRRATDRGHANHGWLDTWHTFSFADYYDPAHMGWRSLRVINEDFVAPKRGFPTHGHRDMEILTYVISGALTHRDSMDHVETLRPGEVQRMSAGHGIMHSEYNAAADEPVHLLQIWLLPDRNGHEPSYEQTGWPPEAFANQLRLLASPDGADGSITLHQDARVYACLLDAGRTLDHPLAEGRGAWVQVVRGRVRVNGEALGAGDGAAVEGAPAVNFEAATDCEWILFDLA